ncbi:MAG: phosphoribosylpyrophosphate synthetase [Pseudobdellovibrionaceae bacterium]
MEQIIDNLDILEAGTGFMLSLSEALHQLEEKGYSENLSARLDHFECRSGQLKLYPKDVRIDGIIRFENTSDPDDQAILYAISIPTLGLKGIYVDTYGLHQDELSREMTERLKNHPH